MPSYADILQWADLYPAGNIALRMLDTTIGIDIDGYNDKTGAQTIADAEGRWGPLPAAPTSTSRDDGVSGIRFYRVPAGRRFVESLGPGVEIIQHTHRYAVVAPSIHPEGRRYRWLDGGPRGPERESAPSVHHLPELPPEWVDGLTDQTPAARAGVDEVQGDNLVRQALTSGIPSGRVATAAARAVDDLASGRVKREHGSRFDYTRDTIAKLMRYGHQGDPGVRAALDELRRTYVTAVGDARTADAARDEYDRAVTSMGPLLAVPDTHPTGAAANEELLAMLPEHRRDDERRRIEALREQALAKMTPIRPDVPPPPPDDDEHQGDNDGEDEPRRPQFLDGGSFIFDQPEGIPGVWGEGNRVLWAEGESLMIAAPMGLGKTTLAGQIIRARLGLGTGNVLGLPVVDTGGVVLYLAMDRPRQIARSLGRQFDAGDRAVVSERLRVWPGPPAVDLARNTDELAAMAAAARADTVVMDSVKDAAVGLKEDEIGALYNRARQKLIAAGVQLLELHHTTKRNAQGGSPDSAADVFGSAWIVNGTGSIIMLSGDPGDPVVGFQHIRQPAEEVGPWQLLHDQAAGKITIHHETDPVAMAIASGEKGITADDLVDAWNPDKKLSGRARLAAREKARRALNKLVDQKKLTRLDGDVGGGAMRRTTSWFPAI
ncbi:hypothetical protein AU190_22235 [Mycolicibacterium acapulense]|nr:hypothetical protein AU190_22235 [Mycolicibacterium acapulense]